MTAWIVLAVILAAAITFLAVTALRMRRIAARLPGVAAELGLTYDGDDPFGLLDQGFALVERGHHVACRR